MARKTSATGPTRFELWPWALLGSLVLAFSLVGMFPTLLIAAILASVLIAAGMGALAIGTIGKATAPRSERAIGRTERSSAMRWPKLGWVEAVLVIVAAALIAFEVGAVRVGLGPQFMVVSLGYFLAAGAAYLLYLHSTARVRVPSGVGAKSSAAIAGSMAVAADSSTTARNSDLLRPLTNEQAGEVLAIGRWESVPAGTRLAEAGSQGEWVYIIVKGMVELTGRSDMGEVTVRVAEVGEAFPLAALLGTGALVTSATAMTDMELVAIPRWRLLSLCADSPEIGMRLFATIAELLAARYRTTLNRHLTGMGDVLRQQDVFRANV